MTHAITRTSPYGERFIGRCDKCGQEGLGMGAPLEPCPMDHIVSDEQALLDCLDRAALPAAAKEQAMSAPERIWAVTEPDDVSAQILGEVYAQQVPDGMVGKPVEYIRADLAPSPAKVKALVWIKHPRCDVWRCDTLIGPYKVFAIKPPVSWDFDGLDNEGISLSTSKVSQSVDAAKAAAQADYEARILAALEE